MDWQNSLLNAFKWIVNTPARIYVPEEQEEKDTNVPRLKHGRPLGSRDVALCKKRRSNQDSILLHSEKTTNGTTLKEVDTHEKIMDSRNNEIFINYCNDLWDRNEIGLNVIDNTFALSIANEIIHDDYEPQSITEYHQRQDWPKWEEVIQAELTSLAKRDVFGLVARTFENLIP